MVWQKGRKKTENGVFGRSRCEGCPVEGLHNVRRALQYLFVCEVVSKETLFAGNAVLTNSYRAGDAAQEAERDE